MLHKKTVILLAAPLIVSTLFYFYAFYAVPHETGLADPNIDIPELKINPVRGYAVIGLIVTWLPVSGVSIVLLWRKHRREKTK